MFKSGLSVCLYLVNCIASGIYARRFLRERRKRFTLPLWSCLYFVCQILLTDRLDVRYLPENLLMILCDIIIVMLLQIFLYEWDFAKQLFVALSYVAGKELIKYISSIWCSILIHDWGELLKHVAGSAIPETAGQYMVWNSVADMGYLLSVLVPYAVSLLTYLYLLAKKFIRKDYRLHVQEAAFLMFPSVAAICISVTLKILIISVENGASILIYEKIPETNFWVPFICILLLGVIVCSVTLFQKLVQCSEEEQKRVILENQMKQLQKELQEIQDIYADMKGLRHDLRSHLQNIAAAIRKTTGKDHAELADYIGKMEATVERMNFACQTGNPITDLIIHQKKQEAERRGIRFEASFIYPGLSENQKIDVYDLGIILNNALENAMEAVSKAEGEKHICLRSYQKGNLFFIEVENDFAGTLDIDSETGLPVSSKQDKRLHGVGMENIRRCARKYQGDMDFAVYDNGSKKKFQLTVMLYERMFTPKMR